MRILSVYIGDYKNLKDFSVSFGGESFVDVLVGKNGTGKSNFFEALLEIFQHLLEDDFIIPFEYKLAWELNDEKRFTHWTGVKWLNMNGEETIKPVPLSLPQNLIVYYSGHNSIISGVLQKYETHHAKKVNANRRSVNFHPNTVRKIIGIDATYKSLLITTLLLQKDDSKARAFVQEKLGITHIGAEILFNLKRPDYAQGKKQIEFIEFKDSDSLEQKRFWGAEGFIEEFLELLWSTEKIPNTHPRKEGYMNPEDSRTDKYHLFRSFDSVRERFSDTDALVIFALLDNLRTIGILESIDIQVELQSGQSIGMDQFSDGQFQSLYIYAITELFKEVNCVTLLDEPDSFLHPEWQYDFLRQVNQISEESTKSNHVLMSSHSAITLLNSVDRRVNLFQFSNDAIVSRSVRKDYAVGQLSDSIVRVQNDKHILSVIHSLGQEKPILFTEGYSDPIILKHAWEKLYQEEMPFEISFGHGCLYLRLLLQNEKFLGEMHLPIFGLFDFDAAWKEWNSISGEETLIEENPYKGIIKKVKDRNSYALLIPIPNHTDIKKQVIREGLETFKAESKVEMEHLFYSDATKDHFKEIDIVGGGKLIEILDSQKMNFATEVVSGLGTEYFEVFRPMFENIQQIISSTPS